MPSSEAALRRAQRLSREAAEEGFDWSDAAGVLAKLDEERAELRAALDAGTLADRAHELGDVLFTLVNLCRHLGVDAERALHGTSDRFERRYGELKRGVRDDGDRVAELDEAELERRWQAAKRRVG